MIGWDQPIVENYVGRQIPTAMVARNLERGSGFLHPQLDTAPFPNHFWVEPPIFAATAVAFHNLAGCGLEPAGRMVSAFAVVLGAWGLFGLAKRREGETVALLAVGAFAFFPLTIRYGRAFQPDAMMLGCLLAGFRCWDQFRAGEGRLWLIPGSLLIALAFALKIVWATMLLPLAILLLTTRPIPVSSQAPDPNAKTSELPQDIASSPQRTILPPRLLLLFLLLIPALLWYIHAASAMSGGRGSQASSDNGQIWIRALIPTALLRAATWNNIGKFLCLRAFTPLGFGLGLGGIFFIPGADRLWKWWTLTVFLTLSLLAAKLHHEYYWLMLAPVVAVGVGRSLDWLGTHGRFPMPGLVGVGFLGLCLAQSLGTWRTPGEWTKLRQAAQTIQKHVPAKDWIVAPEALLFAADRRGCRLEYTVNAATRAAGEWGGPRVRRDPLELIAFYQSQGARYVADLISDDPARLVLHEAIRRRYKIVVDRSGVLLAALSVPEEAPDGTR